MREAATAHGHVVIVATGVATTRALAAAADLAADGIECTVLHMHTVKPLDSDALLHHAAGARLVITVEEHTVTGGLGSAVTDVLVESAPPPLPRIKRLGIPDVFAVKYGNQDELMEYYGLQPPQIAASVRQALRRAL